MLGYVRDVMQLQLLGAGLVNDAFMWAWTIPNAARRLFGEGALSAAFMPVFARVLEHQGAERARRLANVVISSLALLLTGLVIVLVVAVAFVPADSVANALGMETSKVELMFGFLLLLLPYLAVICVIAQFMAVMHTLGEFAVPAVAPILLNVIWIVAVIVAARGWPGDQQSQAWVIIAGILLAAVVQFLWHLPRLRSLGMGFAFVRPQLTDETAEVIRYSGPLLLAMGASQINIVADRSIAMWLLPDGGVSELYAGLRLMQFPLGLVSIALTTAVFPVLNRLLAREERSEAAAATGLALRTNALLSLPAAAGLMVLAVPMVSVLFVGGQFTSEAGGLAADALLGYAAGLPFLGTIMLLNRTCFAMGNPHLAMRVALIAVVVNIVLDLALAGPLGVLGLALATSLTALVHASILYVLVRVRLELRPGQRLMGGLLPMAMATAVMAAVLWFVDEALAGIVSAGRGAQAGRVLMDVVVGVVVFGLLAKWRCRSEWDTVAALWRRDRG